MEVIYNVVKEEDVYKICSVVKGPNGPISTMMPYKFKEHYDAMSFVYRYCTHGGVQFREEDEMEAING